jgi:hypothetical protein
MFNERVQNQPTKRKICILSTILLVIIVGLLSGCASSGPTKPNEIYNGEYPPFFMDIKKQNNLLAEEIGKLPELKAGIQDHEESALRLLCDVHKTNSELFDDVFIQMYRIGLPNTRKYCSPLQALFWLAQEGDSIKIVELMNNYSLDYLLSQAWKFDPATLSDAEITEIIESISDNKLKEQYLRDRKTSSNQQIQHHLLIDYRLNKKIFSKKSKTLLRSKKSFKHPYWKNFHTVIERLNSPELVNYYEQNQMQWVDWRTLPVWPVSAQYVFEYGKGDCTAIADFTALCLKKAGYKAYEYKVAPRRPVDAHHSICVFYVDNIKYVMDNGTSLKVGILLYDEY